MPLVTLERPAGIPLHLGSAYDASAAYLLEACVDGRLPQPRTWWMSMTSAERYRRAFSVMDTTSFADGNHPDYQSDRVGNLSEEDLRRELVRYMVDDSFETMCLTSRWEILADIDDGTYIVPQLYVEDGGERDGSLLLAGREYFAASLAGLEPKSSGHLVCVRALLGLQLRCLLFIKPPGLAAVAGTRLFRQPVSRCAPEGLRAHARTCAGALSRATCSNSHSHPLPVSVSCAGASRRLARYVISREWRRSSRRRGRRRSWR